MLRQGLQNNRLLPLCCYSTEQFAYMRYKVLLNNKIVQHQRKTIWLNLPRQNVGTQFPGNRRLAYIGLRRCAVPFAMKN